MPSGALAALMALTRSTSTTGEASSLSEKNKNHDPPRRTKTRTPATIQPQAKLDGWPELRWPRSICKLFSSASIFDQISRSAERISFLAAAAAGNRPPMLPSATAKTTPATILSGVI